jgi:type II secretory pathway pseudopilin PulG
VAHNKKLVINTHPQKYTLLAFTLVETMISMALISAIFMMVMQAFSSLILGSYIIDARTAVRNESEFVSEYFKLRIKNAEPRSLFCDNNKGEISWQPKGASDRYTFAFIPGSLNSVASFCIDNEAVLNATSCDTMLTYDDVIVKNVVVNCETAKDIVTGQEFSSVNLSFMMDSVAKLGKKPAVSNVTRFVSVSVR